MGDAMKFLQIHTFYDAAIRDIYRDATLKHSSFSTQTQAILKHGFTGTHLIAPYMQRHGYVPALVIANCSWSQHQWLREMGITSEIVSERMIVKRQVEIFRPDVLYIGDPITYDSHFIRALKWRPRAVIGWLASNMPPDIVWSAFDIILSGLRGVRDVAIEHGAKKAVHFLPGFPAWMSNACRAHPVYDVSFAGQWSAAHTKRNAYLKTIAEHTRAQPARTCAFYLLGSPLPSVVARYNQGPRFGVSMYRALRSGAITIDARGDIGVGKKDLAGTETNNARLFEATGSGAFLLAEKHSNLGEMFEIGREIETFGSTLELTAKLMYYKDHPDIREAIALQGQMRCLRDHSMEKRAQQLHQIIKEYLA